MSVVGKTTPLFEFDHVSVRRGDVLILDDVNVDIADAGITVVVGPSGSGKSTLLRCCNRLEPISDGTLRYRGTDITELDPLPHRRRVAMVFQRPTTFPGTVLDNLRAVATDLTRAAAVELLDRAALDGSLVDQQADSLSGGEAQRLAIARALTTEPEVILADEPTSALDATSTKRLEHLARSLADEGFPMVMVTHDLHQVDRLADHVIEVHEGRVTPRNLRNQRG